MRAAHLLLRQQEQTCSLHCLASLSPSCLAATIISCVLSLWLGVGPINKGLSSDGSLWCQVARNMQFVWKPLKWVRNSCAFKFTLIILALFGLTPSSCRFRSFYRILRNVQDLQPSQHGKAGLQFSELVAWLWCLCVWADVKFESSSLEIYWRECSAFDVMMCDHRALKHYSSLCHLSWMTGRRALAFSHRKPLPASSRRGKLAVGWFIYVQ